VSTFLFDCFIPVFLA